MSAELKENIYSKITDYYNIINKIDGIVQHSHFKEDEAKIDLLEKISHELHEATDHMIELYIDYAKNSEDAEAVSEIKNILHSLLEKVKESRGRIKNIYHDILNENETLS